MTVVLYLSLGGVVVSYGTDIYDHKTCMTNDRKRHQMVKPTVVFAAPEKFHVPPFPDPLPTALSRPGEATKENWVKGK